MDLRPEIVTASLLLFASIGLGFLILVFFERFAAHLGLLDIPNHRSSHQTPVPRGAGICFAVTSILTISISYFLGITSFKIFACFTLGAPLVTIVGFWDDIHNLRASLRLLLQILAAGIVIWIATEGLELPIHVRFLPVQSHTLSLFFSLLFVTWMVNLYNFMDGVDGIAGTQAIAIGLLSAYLCIISDNYQLGYSYIILSFSVLPFQLRNWYPARIFMGDSGAYFLGFTFAALALIGKVEHAQSLVAHVTLMGAFICDATLTLLVRVKNSHQILEGHRSHGFQKLLVVYNWNPRQISIFYTLITVLWFFPCALVAQKFKVYSVWICLGSYIPFISYLIYVRVGVEKPSAKTAEASS